MRKITELSETRYKTVREKDATGKKIPKQVEYRAYREVHVISGGKRFAHAFVDIIVYSVLYSFIEYLWQSVSQSDVLGSLFTGFFMTLVFWFSFPIYYVLFEHFLQRTPGKFLTKSLVIDEYGNKPEIGTNILRNIIRWVPFEAFSCLFSDRGWHDRWSDTYVVTEDEYLKIKELQLKLERELDDETIEPTQLPTSKRMKYIFLYVILPLSILLYVGSIYRSCTKAKEIINDPEIVKALKRQQQLEKEMQQRQH